MGDFPDLGIAMSLTNSMYIIRFRSTTSLSVFQLITLMCFVTLRSLSVLQITNDGNWMHIKYQNKLQARCALSRNGRVFGDNIMVGVMPCSDEVSVSVP